MIAIFKIYRSKDEKPFFKKILVTSLQPFKKNNSKTSNLK